MPKPIVVNPGDRFGRWTLIRRLENDASNHRQWLCRCQCGAEKAKPLGQLTSRRSLSCGCGNSHQTKLSHGQTLTPEHIARLSLKQRCLNPKNPGFKNYGGRGISVCEEWRHSFEAFYSHVGKRPSPRHSLDRIENNGNYEPGNVRWATKIQQVRNSRKVLSQ